MGVAMHNDNGQWRIVVSGVGVDAHENDLEVVLGYPPPRDVIIPSLSGGSANDQTCPGGSVHRTFPH
jgi:hypothetical protein